MSNRAEHLQLEKTSIIDRTGWPAGPWDDEPDRIEWRFKGLPCLMVRNNYGVWCGYVGTPLGAFSDKGIDPESFSAHGGINYQGPCSAPICHVPEPGESEVYWIGFDTGHAWDLSPGLLTRLGESPIMRNFIDRHDWTYRDVAYVRHEVEDLAEQVLHALHGCPPPG